MKVALVHDFLNQYGGAERELEALAEVWPEAQIYTSIYDKNLMNSWLKIDPARIHTNLIQKLPAAHYLNKHYFFLYPLAFRFVNPGDVDVVISISSYASKFVVARKPAIHIGYINTPPRFLYGYDRELTGYKHRSFDRYLEPAYKLVAPSLKSILRVADQNAVKKIDYLVANSKEVQRRIKRDYGRDSTVIYPPVDVEKFSYIGEVETNEKFFLIVSRLGGYKKIDIAIKAFNQLGLRLKILGDGPQMPYLRSIAEPNIEFLGRTSDEILAKELLSCTALIFPTDEDFGIVPVEAQAAGKPVIAYRSGGALETVIEDKTGLFFDEQTAEAIIGAVKRFETGHFDPKDARANAQKFSKEEFKRSFKFFVEEAFHSVKK